MSKLKDYLEYTLSAEYKRDNRLNDLVKDKSIAIIGPAPNLVGQGKGEFIDSHDLVFRLGDSPVGFKGRYDRAVDYGKRTDVLVHSFNEHDRPCLDQDRKWLQSLKYMISPMVWAGDAGKNTQWLNELNVPWHHVPDHHIKPGLFNLNHSLPNTGFIGILTMLNYDIKSMYISGMTFYNMGKDYKVYGQYHETTSRTIHDSESPYYFKEWFDEPKYQKEGFVWGKGHIPANDIKHFREILKVKKHKDRIILDEYLTKNFV